MTATTINEAAILETLRHVIDPEIGCNIVDLGLIYNIAVSGAKVAVTMTLTTPGCPMHESIGWGVQNSLLAQPGGEEIEVEIVWDPHWHPSMMTEVLRDATGMRDF
jgi:metal-sulfur cluster biosynthetic enzyme